MRIHVTSLRHARTLAKRLGRLLRQFNGPDLGHVEAQSALSAMLGYGDWAELVRVTAGRPEPTPYDERVPGLVDGRVAYQAGRLSDATGLDPVRAAFVAGMLRASAHPAGPHVDGLDPEPRGRMPNGEAMSISGGAFRPPAYRAVSVAEALATAPGEPVGTRMPKEWLPTLGDLNALPAGGMLVLGDDPPLALDLHRIRYALYDGRTHPATRDGYLVWLLGRIEGYGNEMSEPIRSLVAEGLVETVERRFSLALRLTGTGREAAGAIAARTGMAA